MTAPESSEEVDLDPWRNTLVKSFCETAANREKPFSISLSSRLLLQKINKQNSSGFDPSTVAEVIKEFTDKTEHDFELLLTTREDATLKTAKDVNGFFEALVQDSDEFPKLTPDQLHDVVKKHPEVFLSVGTPPELAMPAVQILAAQGKEELFGPRPTKDSPVKSIFAKKTAPQFADDPRFTELADEMRAALAETQQIDTGHGLMHMPRKCAVSFDRSSGAALIVRGEDTIPPSSPTTKKQRSLFGSNARIPIGILNREVRFINPGLSPEVEVPPWLSDKADKFLTRHQDGIPAVYVTTPHKKGYDSEIASVAISSLLARYQNSVELFPFERPGLYRPSLKIDEESIMLAPEFASRVERNRGSTGRPSSRVGRAVIRPLEGLMDKWENWRRPPGPPVKRW